MADDTIVNGVASESDVDDGTVENDKVMKQDRDLDLGKIEALEQEKSGLLKENREMNERIRVLNDEIEGFKRNEAEVKERLEKMQKEINESEEDKRSLLAVAARAQELETEVSRLQSDLISTMSESDDTAAELRKVKIELEALKKRIGEKEAKIEDLERERASLLEQIEKEGELVKKLKAENENHVRDLKTREVQISERESEVLGLQTLKNEKDTQKSALEVALKQAVEKFKEMDAEAKRLKRELFDKEKVIVELKDKFMEKNESGDSKVLLPAVIASTGTVVVVAAVACYVAYARRR